MVDFELPQFNLEMQEMIARQTIMIENLFEQGVLVTYTMAADKSRLWAVFQADSESELLSYVESLPLTIYADYNYSELLFHDTCHFVPIISLN